MRFSIQSIAAIILLATAPVSAASAQLRPGLEIQLYPAGQIGDISLTWTSAVAEWTLLAGYNRARRQDFGEKDHESGGGPGAGLRLAVSLDKQGRLTVGPSLYVWWLHIDWIETLDPCGDLPCMMPFIHRTGETDITVLQPGARLDYRFLSFPTWTLSVGVELGKEINVRTKGEEVGQGPILVGSLSMRLN